MEVFKRKVDVLQVTQEYCEQIVESTKEIQESKREYKQVQSYLSDIQNLEMLPSEQMDKIIHLSKQVQNIEKDKLIYKNEINKLTKEQYNYILYNEDKLLQGIRTAQEEEIRLQRIKGDMNYLEGEKEALKIEQQEYNNRLYVLRGIAKVAIISLIILFCLLLVGQFILSLELMVYIYLLIALSIIITLIIFLVNRKTIFLLSVNQKKLNKAINMLNKVKLQYVNGSASVEYIYEKNNVHNSYELNNLWIQYNKLKKDKDVYKNASSKLYNVTQELYDLLTLYQVTNGNEWLSRTELIVDSAKREERFKELSERRKRLIEKIEENKKVLETAKEKIKELAIKHKEDANEILNIVDQYGDLMRFNSEEK